MCGARILTASSAGDRRRGFVKAGIRPRPGQDAGAGSQDGGAAAGRGAGGHRVICLEQSAARALAAGATTDEIASVPVKLPLISYDN